MPCRYAMHLRTPSRIGSKFFFWLSNWEHLRKRSNSLAVDEMLSKDSPKWTSWEKRPQSIGAPRVFRIARWAFFYGSSPSKLKLGKQSFGNWRPVPTSQKNHCSLLLKEYMSG